MPGEVEQGDLRVLGEELGDLVLEIITRDPIARTRAGQQLAVEIDLGVDVAVTFKSLLEGACVIDAAMEEEAHMVVKVNPDDQRDSHPSPATISTMRTKKKS